MGWDEMRCDEMSGAAATFVCSLAARWFAISLAGPKQTSQKCDTHTLHAPQHQRGSKRGRGRALFRGVPSEAPPGHTHRASAATMRAPGAPSGKAPAARGRRPKANTGRAGAQSKSIIMFSALISIHFFISSRLARETLKRNISSVGQIGRRKLLSARVGPRRRDDKSLRDSDDEPNH